MPEVVIALDELPDGKGTSIRMTYDMQILKSDGTPLDGALMKPLWPPGLGRRHGRARLRDDRRR